MIYQKQFFKDVTYTAIAIFFVVLAILVFTQGTNLLGRAADGRVAIDAVAVLIGFWTLGMSPLLLLLTTYISILTVLMRYWRDSEMAIWLSSGLSLKQWLIPILGFCMPLAVLVAVMQLSVLPWVELRSHEYAEILKQKQNLSLVQSGTFAKLSKENQRVYFVEQFNEDEGKFRHLFLREIDKNGRDNVIFAQQGYFDLKDNKRTLVLQEGYSYAGIPGAGDFSVVSFGEMRMVVTTTPKLIDQIKNRRTITTSQLWQNPSPSNQAELMWRISLPLALIVLSVMALPLSYTNPRSGRSYQILWAIGFFLIYQNGLTLLRNLIENGKISFWLGFFPLHLLMLAIAIFWLHRKNRPA